VSLSLSFFSLFEHIQKEKGKKKMCHILTCVCVCERERERERERDFLKVVGII